MTTQVAKETIGFIGLGIMGRPMALNLIRAGFPLCAYARRESSLEPVVAAGGRPCSSAGELAQSSDIVITIVSDTPDVEDVILGPTGVIHGIRPGSLVIDMSTISPLATKRIGEALAKSGVDMLDAPVSGGEHGAINAKLSIMVGGEATALERARPVFAALGERIVHIGGLGSGQLAKACNQLVIAQSLTAVGEALLLAQRCGADPGRVREALLGGLAASRVLEVHGARALSGDYKPGFKAKLHCKDLRIVLETASAVGLPLPGSTLATQYMTGLLAAGGGELDSAAVITVLEQLAGVHLSDAERSV